MKTVVHVCRRQFESMPSHSTRHVELEAKNFKKKILFPILVAITRAYLGLRLFLNPRSNIAKLADCISKDQERLSNLTEPEFLHHGSQYKKCTLLLCLTLQTEILSFS